MTLTSRLRASLFAVTLLLILPALGLAGCGGDGGPVTSDSWAVEGGGERGPAIALLCVDAKGRGNCATLHASGGYPDLMEVCVAEMLWTCSEWMARHASSIVVLPEAGPVRISLHEEKDYQGKTRVIDATAAGPVELTGYDFNDRTRSIKVMPLKAKAPAAK